MNALTTLLVALTTAFGDPAVDPRAELETWYRAALTAYRTNDAAAIDTLMGEEYVIINSDGSTSTKADDVRAARDRDNTFSRFENVDMTFQFFGTTAVVRGRTLIAGVARVSGRPFEVDVLFTDVMVKRNGKWQMVAGHVVRTPQRQ
jgi:ketosteroid isomerase-like protein